MSIQHPSQPLDSTDTGADARRGEPAPAQADERDGSADPTVGAVRPHDAGLMTQARVEAEKGRGRTSPNPLVGALIVDETGPEPIVLGRGHHARLGGDHAEVAALKDVGDRARGMTLYVTLEPCNHVGRTGRCTDAILAAGIRRVVFAVRDPNPAVTGGGADRLRAAGIAVVEGVDAAACRQQNRGFFRVLSTGRPHVLMKAALSLDGRLAPMTGRAPETSDEAGATHRAPIWLTGATARRRVHELRDGCDAILVGSGTVLADDPRLNVRLPEGVLRPRENGGPLRVVVDGRLRTPRAAQLLGPGALIVTTAAAAQAQPDAVGRLRDGGCEVLTLPTAGATGGAQPRIDLGALLTLLARRGVAYVLCEGGATLHGALLSAGLYDGAALFVAPLFLGDRGVPLFAGPPIPDLTQAPWLSDAQIERLGDDWLVTGTVRRGPYTPAAGTNE